MPTYILLSNLTDDGAKALKAKPKRLQEVNKEIERFGAKVTAQYAVLGLYDFVSILECPTTRRSPACRWSLPRAAACGSSRCRRCRSRTSSAT